MSLALDASMTLACHFTDEITFVEDDILEQ